MPRRSAACVRFPPASSIARRIIATSTRSTASGSVPANQPARFLVQRDTARPRHEKVEVGRGDHRPPHEGRRPLHGVQELADIAWPGMCEQPRRRVR